MAGKAFYRTLDPSADEHGRIAAIRRYVTQGSSSGKRIDRITALAAKAMRCPMSAISIVDVDSIWFTSSYGFTLKEVKREPGFCGSAILSADPWLVESADTDPRACFNALTVGHLGLKFYLGIPLTTKDGFNIGTLCVLDRTSREVSLDQIVILKGLARTAMDLFEYQSEVRDAIVKIESELHVTKILAKEIDHRVMNSLQLLTTMMNLQAAQLPIGKGSDEIKRAAGRIAAIGRIHQHLHLDSATDPMDPYLYLTDLCVDLSRIFSSGTKLNVESIHSKMSPMMLMRMGLIVNELITNAVKQGATVVSVSFETTSGGSYLLSVADDGRGVPFDFDLKKTSGFGLVMVGSLVKGLAGTLTVTNNASGKGATFVTTFLS